MLVTYGLNNEGIRMQGLSLSDSVHKVHLPTWKMRLEYVHPSWIYHERCHIILLHILKARAEEHPDIQLWLDNNLYQGTESSEVVCFGIEAFLNNDPLDAFGLNSIEEIVYAANELYAKPFEPKEARGRGGLWAATYISEIENKTIFDVLQNNEFDAKDLAEKAISLYTERDEEDVFFSMKDRIDYSRIFNPYEKEAIKHVFKGLLPLLHYLKDQAQDAQDKEKRSKIINSFTINEIIDLVTNYDVDIKNRKLITRS